MCYTICGRVRDASIGGGSEERRKLRSLRLLRWRLAPPLLHKSLATPAHHPHQARCCFPCPLVNPLPPLGFPVKSCRFHHHFVSSVAYYLISLSPFPFRYLLNAFILFDPRFRPKTIRPPSPLSCHNSRPPRVS